MTSRTDTPQALSSCELESTAGDGVVPTRRPGDTDAFLGSDDGEGAGQRSASSFTSWKVIRTSPGIRARPGKW